MAPKKDKLLAVDNDGLPMVSLKAQKALRMSDEQRERLTPIAIMMSTLVGLYTAWQTLSAAADHGKE